MCKALAIAMMAVLLHACATSRTIQVPTSCVTASPKREASVLDSLPKNPNAYPSEEARLYAGLQALLIDRDITEIYIDDLEAIVAGCR